METKKNPQKIPQKTVARKENPARVKVNEFVDQARKDLENSTNGNLIKEMMPAKKKKVLKSQPKKEKEDKKRKGFILTKEMCQRLNIINDDLNESLDDCVIRFKKMREGE